MFKETDEKVRDKIDEAIAKKFDEAEERLKRELERDHEQLLEQFLQNQKVSRPEFELVLRTNVYLRKIAEPRVAGQINDEELQGLRDRVRRVGPRAASRATRRNSRARRPAADRGEKFEAVARQMSRNPQTRRASAASCRGSASRRPGCRRTSSGPRST